MLLHKSTLLPFLIFHESKPFYKLITMKHLTSYTKYYKIEKYSKF